MGFIAKRAWSLKKLISRLCSRKTEILQRKSNASTDTERQPAAVFQFKLNVFLCNINNVIAEINRRFQQQILLFMAIPTPSRKRAVNTSCSLCSDT